MGWFLPALVGGLAAGGASAGLGALLGGGGDDEGSVNVEDMYPSWTKEAASVMSPWVQKYVPQYVPGEAYGGQLSAQMTPFEKTGLDVLSGYMDAPNIGNAFTAGKGQIMDTLSGKYMSPETSPFLQAMNRMGQRTLADQISQSRAGAGARGTFFGSQAMNQENLLRENMANSLNALTGQFIQNERQNMLGAVPQAMGIDEYESVLAPLKKVASSQTLGNLQRVLEQSDLERKYQEFTRQRTEKALPIQAGLSLMNTGYSGSGGTMNAPQQGNSLMNLLAGMVGPQLGSSLLSGFFNRGGNSGNSGFQMEYNDYNPNLGVTGIGPSMTGLY